MGVELDIDGAEMPHASGGRVWFSCHPTSSASNDSLAPRSRRKAGRNSSYFSIGVPYIVTQDCASCAKLRVGIEVM
jgi:hypothetical protein